MQGSSFAGLFGSFLLLFRLLFMMTIYISIELDPKKSIIRKILLFMPIKNLISFKTKNIAKNY